MLLEIVVVIQDKDDRLLSLQILIGIGRHDGDNALGIWFLHLHRI